MDVKIATLTPEECWDRLAESDMGRLAVVIRGHPFIFPVNYFLDGQTVVFRTDAGVKLDGLLESPSVAFEADHVDRQAGTAWSVVVAGQASLLADPSDVAQIDVAPQVPWDTGPKPYLVEILTQDISGRALRGPLHLASEMH